MTFVVFGSHLAREGIPRWVKCGFLMIGNNHEAAVLVKRQKTRVNLY